METGNASRAEPGRFLTEKSLKEVLDMLWYSCLPEQLFSRLKRAPAENMVKTEKGLETWAWELSLFVRFLPPL